MCDHKYAHSRTLSHTHTHTFIQHTVVTKRYGYETSLSDWKDD